MSAKQHSGIKIKLCGMTCREDIELVNRLRPDYAGFVMFFPKSRRDLSPERAGRLAAELCGVRSVAVTVSPTAEQVCKAADTGFKIIQIHGNLSDDTYAACERRGIEIIRAFNSFDHDEIERCAALTLVKAFLFDAAQPGSGKTFDWTELERFDRRGRELFLAGGLDPRNVGAAIAAVRPDCVDVSSGIEKPQGGKDPLTAEQFVKNARAAAAEL